MSTFYDDVPEFKIYDAAEPWPDPEWMLETAINSVYTVYSTATCLETGCKIVYVFGPDGRVCE